MTPNTRAAARNDGRHSPTAVLRGKALFIPAKNCREIVARVEARLKGNVSNRLVPVLTKELGGDHVDQDDVVEVHRKIGHKFCISGGVPNYLLAYESPQIVRQFCKRVIDEVAADGGYILDASAIMQNETSIENMRAMTDFVRDYGRY